MRVPREAFKFKDSAPPRMFRHIKLAYAEPSAFPTSVPVLNKIRDFSFTDKYTSKSVGVVDASVCGDLSKYRDIGR